jgi:hypothetical protein
LAGGVGAGQPLLWSRKARLQRNTGVDPDTTELREPGIEQAQPLIRVVVAIKKQLRIGGVIVAVVECLKLFVGQVRDVLRVGVSSSAD